MRVDGLIINLSNGQNFTKQLERKGLGYMCLYLTYGGQEMMKLIEVAIKRAQEFGYLNVPELISDQGTKNVNSLIKGLDTKKIISR